MGSRLVIGEGHNRSRPSFPGRLWHTVYMTPKITSEQREALKQDGGPVPVEDDQTHQVYFLVDKVTLDTLRQDAAREAIRKGIADMEAGRVVTLDELDARIQAKIRRPKSA